MKLEDASKLLQQADHYVHSNLQDISEQEALELPSGGANPFNWILGHIVFWRGTMLQMLGGEMPAIDEELEQYKGRPGEGQPLEFDASRALPIARLGSDFESFGQALLERLRGEHADLESVLPLLLHEAYHAGQLGLARRALGKAGLV